MENIDKLKKISEEDLKKLQEEYKSSEVSYTFNFVVNDKPIPYSRARLGWNKKFYNPKDDKKKKLKKLLFNQLTPEQNCLIQKLFLSDTAEYYVKINASFYVPINKTDSIKTTALKEMKCLKPTLRNGDIDNYVKFILDALHDVIYLDDKVVVSVNAEKYFSITPRSEITATLIITHF